MSANCIAQITGYEENLKEPNWYALHTRVNQEKRVAEGLDGRGVPFFLPLYKTVRRRSDRKVALSLPLFPGYLFVHIPLAERLQVLEVPRVVGLVGSQRRPSALPSNEIDVLRHGLAGQVHAEPCSYLPVGCRVRVVNGPFEGLEGVLLSSASKPRVVISIEVIMRSFTVELNQYNLERFESFLTCFASLQNSVSSAWVSWPAFC